MKTQGLQNDWKTNLQTVKKALPAEDVLTYAFCTENGINCALVYADGMVNKQLLGELVARPLSALSPQKEGDGVAITAFQTLISQTVRFPEIKEIPTLQDAVKEVLDGNALLLVDGAPIAWMVGTKMLPVRAVAEPPTDVAVKGPREGFIEDIKTNMSLIRKRLKTPDLRFQTLRVGKRSDTAVTLCYLEGTSNPKLKDELVQKLKKIKEIYF